MNDKDKEAFKNWFEKYWQDSDDKDLFADVWQAACGYKQKELDELRLQYDKLTDWASEYVAENAKLIESLKFTISAAEYLFKPDVNLEKGMNPTSYFTLSYEGDLELIEKTKRARQVLKELDEE